MRKKSYDVSISFLVNITDVEDPDDLSEVAQKTKIALWDRVNSDSLGENIESVEFYDDREFPCDSCEEGEMVVEYTYPTHFETISVYKCDQCGHTVSFP